MVSGQESFNLTNRNFQAESFSSTLGFHSLEKQAMISKADRESLSIGSMFN